jgi:hypothetical protein
MKEAEIRAAFVRVRDLLAKSAIAKQSNRRAEVEFAEITQISVSLLEGFLLDVNRIANALEAKAS